MEVNNFTRVGEIKRSIYLIMISFGLLSYGNIAPAVAGGPEAHLKGEFGPLHKWPIMPIHLALMPEGTVFAFGNKGAAKNALYYAIWDPSIWYRQQCI